MDQKKDGLKENALGIEESIIMGVAGTAPAYSIAATTSILYLAVGLQSIASLFYCGLIMFGVSLAFMHLNKIHVNAGGSFVWIGNIFNPVWGFFAGWSLLVAACVFMVSGTIPAAVATLALFNSAEVSNPVIVSLVASLWLIFISFVVTKGIKLSSYFQMFLTLVEVLILVLIIFGAIWMFYQTPVQAFDFSQLSIFKFTPETFATGALTSLYFFWGWDVTVNLSEETKNASDNPGIAAIFSMMIVFLLFTSFMIATQFSLTENEIINADANLILAVAEKVFPSSWSNMAIIAVMLSTVGTLETTILQFTRTMYAKSRSNVLHPRYAKLHKTWQTPWVSTCVITGIGLVLLAGAAFFQTVNQIIFVSVKAIGFQVAFYYGLACFACAWKFRSTPIKNYKKFIILFFWPLISAAFMAFIFIYCAYSFDWMTTALGIGAIVVGIIPFYLNRKNNKHFLN